LFNKIEQKLLSIDRSNKTVAKWSISIDYVATFIAFGRNFILFPVYLKFIDTNIFGAWLATGNLIMWLTIIDPGVGEVFKQRVAECYAKMDKMVLGNLISSGFFLSIIISTIALLISVYLSIRLPEIINSKYLIDTKQLTYAFHILSVGTCFSLFTFSLSGIISGMQGVRTIGVAYLLANVLEIILNVVLLYMGWGLIAIAAAMLFRTGIIMVVNIIYLFTRISAEKIKPTFNFAYFVSFSKIFGYTFVSKIASTIKDNIDLLTVAWFVNAETVTMFEIVRRPIKLVHSLSNRLSGSIIPVLSFIKGENNLVRFKSIFIRFIYINLWLLGLITIEFIIFNEFLVKIWIGKDVFIGNSYNIVICITYLLTSMIYSVSNFVFAYGMIMENSKINLYASILYMPLILVLGKYFGVWGIILTPLISLLATQFWYLPLKLAGVLSISKSEYYKYLVENIVLLVLSLGIIFVFAKTNPSSWLQLILGCFEVFLAYFVLIGTFSINFRNEVKALLPKVFSSGK